MTPSFFKRYLIAFNKYKWLSLASFGLIMGASGVVALQTKASFTYVANGTLSYNGSPVPLSTNNNQTQQQEQILSKDILLSNQLIETVAKDTQVRVVSQKQVGGKVGKPKTSNLTFPMSTPSLFKWRQFLPEIILLNVRWYCRYPLSYRNLEDMMVERGIEVDHSIINRWVLKYAPELNKQIRPHLKKTNDEGRVDETYIKVKGQWKYLYRAVDSEGNTLDFLFSAKRDTQAAERFLRKTLNAAHTQTPRVINVDKNAAYPPAVDDLKADAQLPETTQLRQVKYLNNRVELSAPLHQTADKTWNGIWLVQHS